MVSGVKPSVGCVCLLVVVLIAEQYHETEAISFRTGWNRSTYQRRENQMVNRQRALNKGMYPHLVPNKFMTRAEEHDEGWKQFTSSSKPPTRKPKAAAPSAGGAGASTAEPVTPAPRGKWPGYKCCATQRIELASGFGAPT